MRPKLQEILCNVGSGVIANFACREFKQKARNLKTSINTRKLN